MSDSPLSLIARADWKNPDGYPDLDTANSEHWAWEFLRRNQRYAADVERLPQLKPTDQEALRLKWEVSYLLSPDIAWHQLPSDFHFLANIAEVIEPIMPLGSRNISDASVARVATEQSVLATSRQVLVRLTLDGNIDNQLQDLKEKYRLCNHSHPQTDKQVSGTVTQIVYSDVKLVSTEIETLPDGSQITRYNYEDNWDDTPGRELVFFYSEKQKRALIKHLFFALRAVDAIATYLGTFSDSKISIEEAIQNAARQLQPVLYKEWEQEGRYAESVAVGDLARIQVDQVVNWIAHGLQYTQEERYRDIASSDLKKQLQPIKKNG